MKSRTVAVKEWKKIRDGMEISMDKFAAVELSVIREASETAEMQNKDTSSSAGKKKNLAVSQRKNTTR